jgi:hypothetical protein
VQVETTGAPRGAGAAPCGARTPRARRRRPASRADREARLVEASANDLTCVEHFDRHSESDELRRALIDEGNFLNWYDRREDAERAVLEVAEQDGAEAAQFGYFAHDDAGQPVGDFISGAELLAKRSAAA